MPPDTGYRLIITPMNHCKRNETTKIVKLSSENARPETAGSNSRPVIENEIIVIVALNITQHQSGAAGPPKKAIAATTAVNRAPAQK